MNGGRDFALLEAHLRNSVLVRSVERIAASAAAAFSYAAITRRVYSIRVRFAALPAAERLRGVAALVATATIGHLVGLRIVPAHIAPALPKAFWVLGHYQEMGLRHRCKLAFVAPQRTSKIQKIGAPSGASRSSCLVKSPAATIAVT